MVDFGVQLERIVAELISGLLSAARVAGLEHRRQQLKMLERAIAWQRELEEGSSIAAIARREGLSRSEVTQTIGLIEELEGGDELAGGTGGASPGANHVTARAKPGGKIASYRELRRKMLFRFDTDYITEVLAAAENNVSRAAKMASIDRKHLWRLIQRTRVGGGRGGRRRTR